jgi:hypothetical protein
VRLRAKSRIDPPAAYSGLLPETLRKVRQALRMDLQPPQSSRAACQAQGKMPLSRRLILAKKYVTVFTNRSTKDLQAALVEGEVLLINPRVNCVVAVINGEGD